MIDQVVFESNVASVYSGAVRERCHCSRSVWLLFLLFVIDNSPVNRGGKWCSFGKECAVG